MKQTLRLLAGIYGRIAALALLIGAILRIVLLFNEQTTDIDFSAGEWFAIFAAGALNDLCIATIAFAPLWGYLVTVSEAKYRSPQGYLLFALLTAAFGYLLLFHTPFHDYGGAAVRAARAVLGWWFLSFGLRLFLPRIRPYWTRAGFFLITTLYVALLLFNGVSEYLFWSEFGVRYNFIAVDYLVYTNEVIGNIVESYPVGWILAVLLLATLAVRQLLFGRIRRIDEALNRPLWRFVALPAYLLAVIVALALLQFALRFQQSENEYANELQANGVQRFYDAFVKNELRYDRFYSTLPDEQVDAALRSLYGDSGVHRTIRGDREEQLRNIVLISIESMSASFLERFGNTEHLTPVLDSLYERGLAFDRLYATGNRTVRGLEALTLSLPPSAGQSLIKRPDNASRISVGEILAAKGYDVLYFYGGNSYFDNMGSFFGGNGYRIVDQSDYAPDEITFSNIWGVADDDAYRKALRTLDTLALNGRPFFAHLMTVSNHRPFTYPEGSVPEELARTRAGGVMYSDHALGEFLRAASREPWFGNTIFLITADHCASSAGKTELPLEKYHIPAVIYAPDFVYPQVERRIVSQIDLMPTLFALLGLSYESPLLRPQHLRARLHGARFRGDLSGSGVHRGRTAHDPLARAARRAVRHPPHAREPAPHRAAERNRLDGAAPCDRLLSVGRRGDRSGD